MSLLLVLAGALHAQMIKSLTATGGPSGFNYDTANDPYWAQFGVSGTDATASASSVNVMSGASSAVTVSSITESGDSIDARTQYTSKIDFVYDNGTSPQSSTTNNAGDISVQTGYGGSEPSSGQALTFTLTFNQAVSEGSLDLVANDYQGASTFNFAFSNGATEPVNDPYPPDVDNDDDIYTLSFADVPVGSVLTVTDTMTSTLGNGNTSISGVAFTVLDVPEPSIWAMMIAGMAFLGFRLRRKSV